MVQLYAIDLEQAQEPVVLLIVSGFLLENNWLPCLPSCGRKPRNELIYMKCDDQRKDMGGYQLFCHVNVSYDFHYVSSSFFFLFCFAEI